MFYTVLLMETVLAAYMSSPCHIELILSEKEEPVRKEVLDSSVCCFVFHFFDDWLSNYCSFVCP